MSVLSDGDRTARSIETGGDRSVEHSAGVVQVGAPGLDAPVDAVGEVDHANTALELAGDGPAGTEARLGARLGEESPGSTAGLTVRLAALSGQAAAVGVAGSGGSGPASGGGVGLDEPDGGTGAPNGVQLAGGGPSPSGGGTLPAGLFQAGGLAADAGTLPLTGLRAWLLIGAGVWLLASGLALLLLGSLLRASGNHRESEHGRFAR